MCARVCVAGTLRRALIAGAQRDYVERVCIDHTAEAAKDFVMVNLEDNEEPQSDTYRPDGGYIPRILFVHSGSGAVMDVFNDG